MYLLKKNFSELGLHQNGCIKRKSATGLYFLNIGEGGFLINYLCKIKKKRKALIFTNFGTKFSNGFNN